VSEVDAQKAVKAAHVHEFDIVAAAYFDNGENFLQWKLFWTREFVEADPFIITN
jgi:hypothetical protein